MPKSNGSVVGPGIPSVIPRFGPPGEMTTPLLGPPTPYTTRLLSKMQVYFLNSFHLEEVNPRTQEVAMKMRLACRLVGGTHLHPLSLQGMLTVLSIRGIFLIRA